MLIEKSYITILLKKIDNFNINHQSGWSNIPYLCIKIKHGNGFSWYGLNIVKYENITWDNNKVKEIKKEISDALGLITDLESIVSDMDRVIDSILETVNEKKTNLLLSNINVDESISTVILKNERSEIRNIILSLNLSNGVTFEMYDGELDYDSLSYGGFAVTVETPTGKYPGMIYHRTVILNHYVDKEDIETTLSKALESYFKPIVEEKFKVEVIRDIERNRNGRTVKSPKQ